MIRLGLCCAFRDEPIRFRTTTAAAMLRLPRTRQLARIAELIRHNADALRVAIQFCARRGIGCFRVNSQILPLKTHPALAYDLWQLPDADDLISRFKIAGQLAAALDVRLTFHPDQFVVLNSPHESVVAGSVAELEYQAQVADWIGADVIIIHGGGAYGDKQAALDRLRANLERLSAAVRGRLALENDDRVYAPADLLGLCRAERIPFVYDVHHHRCLPDGRTPEQVTRAARETWNREPLFHVSSPASGGSRGDLRMHADFINPRDLPSCWNSQRLTVEVEARAKEVAVLRLRRALLRRARARRGASSGAALGGGRRPPTNARSATLTVS